MTSSSPSPSVSQDENSIDKDITHLQWMNIPPRIRFSCPRWGIFEVEGGRPQPEGEVVFVGNLSG